MHRDFVGPRSSYDLVGSSQFCLLIALGMREHHSLLDIGCGSLRGGRFAIMYLNAGNYCGIEPEQWLVQDAIEHEVGNDLIRLKRPTFKYQRDFPLTAFGQKFDFIMAQSIFSHAAPDQIQRCLSETRKVLSPNGICVATFCRGDSDYQGKEWVYPGAVKFTLTFFLELTRNLELECQPLDWKHPHGQSWIAITHPDKTKQLPLLPDNFGVNGLGSAMDAKSE
jgi:SAM-dependent methyltransferase